jgi:hypothetical protein
LDPAAVTAAGVFDHAPAPYPAPRRGLGFHRMGV